MKATKRMKFVLTALMACVVGLSGLPGASSAEAGVELDDIQISARWRGDHRPPPPPPHGGPRRFRGRHRYGPHGHWGFYGPGPHGPRRHGPPPPPPPHHHHRGRW